VVVMVLFAAVTVRLVVRHVAQNSPGGRLLFLAWCRSEAFGFIRYRLLTNVIVVYYFALDVTDIYINKTRADSVWTKDPGWTFLFGYHFHGSGKFEFFPRRIVAVMTGGGGRTEPERESPEIPVSTLSAENHRIEFSEFDF